jgi:hypothetical protein
MRRLVVTAAAVCAGLACSACGSAAGAPARHRSCPPNDRTFAPSPEAATEATLVPGDPAAVLVCRYWGRWDTGAPRSLAGQRQLPGGPKLRSFVQKLNALPPIPKDPAPSCPASGGRSVLLLFRYRDAPDDPVLIVSAGCTLVSNGHIRERFGEGLNLGEHWADEGAL